MNKTKGKSSFLLTILDSNNNTVYMRTCSVTYRTNWYLFYMNQKWFSKGEYTIHAVADTWNTIKQ